jgi:D-beta-D-heptose 7-phosphate kinase / D-beta-D-heptose 1-phosphate adenosyltransferase
MSYHLINLLQKLGRPRVLVLGDLILDRYTWGDAERVSQEAPVILLREERREARLGGAANVANMLRGLEADVALAGVIGKDNDGVELRAALERAGVDCGCLLVDPERPTTVKERFIGRAQQRHPHQILRVDREVRMPLAAAQARALTEGIQETLGDYQAVLISEYGKGVCTPEICRKVIEAARSAGIPVIVDPSSSGDCRNFVGANAVTPNRLETKRATGRAITTIEDAMAAGKRLCAELSLDHAFITLDSDGIVVAQADGSAEHLPTRKREVYDITGAGDMVLAMIGLGAAAGIQPIDLARLANVAGGLEVEQIGVVPITRQQILADLFGGERSTSDKICTIDVLERHVAARRRLGKRIVLTNGCFDLLHVGHVTYLQQAAREGDCLIVAINSDASVRQLGKAPDRPIFGEIERAAMLAALEAVDYVTIFGEKTPHAVLGRLKPDLLVKGGTYATHEIVGRELVESYGGQVKALGKVPGVSTTLVLEQLRGSKAA